MNPLAKLLEAALFASPRPIPAAELAALDPESSPAALQAALESLREHYDVDGHGVELVEQGGGWLILTRPAVEAGEKLGFLPGDLQQKVDPYLRPLYDALHTLLGQERTAALIEKNVIEVAPLAYMRGRTLAEAFVILDEAQNTTTAQMRMVLTRLGEGSRMVVTGDPTQIDLPPGQLSGLIEAAQVLEGVEGVAICRLTAADVVRHPLVQRLVTAYASRDANRMASTTPKRFDGPQMRTSQ